MTPDERALNLRAELAALGVPAEHIAFRLLDRRDPLTGSVDLLCMEAVDTILAFRDHATACRTLVKNAEDENAKLRDLVEQLRLRGAEQPAAQEEAAAPSPTRRRSAN